MITVQVKGSATERQLPNQVGTLDTRPKEAVLEILTTNEALRAIRLDQKLTQTAFGEATMHLFNNAAGNVGCVWQASYINAEVSKRECGWIGVYRSEIDALCQHFYSMPGKEKFPQLQEMPGRRVANTLGKRDRKMLPAAWSSLSDEDRKEISKLITDRANKSQQKREIDSLLASLAKLSPEAAQAAMAAMRGTNA